MQYGKEIWLSTIKEVYIMIHSVIQQEGRSNVQIFKFERSKIFFGQNLNHNNPKFKFEPPRSNLNFNLRWKKFKSSNINLNFGYYGSSYLPKMEKFSNLKVQIWTNFRFERPSCWITQCTRRVFRSEYLR